jgi:hypothetical protein
MNLFAVSQFLRRQAAHGGVHMDGIDRFAVRMLIQYPAYCSEHVPHWFPDILAPMCRDKDQFTVSNPI